MKKVIYIPNQKCNIPWCSDYDFKTHSELLNEQEKLNSNKMKQLKNYFKSLPFNTKSNITVIAFFIIMFALVGMCTSCSVTRPIQTKPDFQIEWPDTSYTIIPPNEDLLKPNMKDYKVLDYRYPYATVLIMNPDSVIAFKYSLEPLEIGAFGISEFR